MKIKNQLTKLRIYALLSLTIAILVFHWVQSKSHSEAIEVVNNDTLTKNEKFLKIASLAYDENENPQALYLLYNMLIHGYGVQESPQTAIFILEKSAKAGYGPAQEDLAFLYLNGHEHLRKDYNKAYYWLKKASQSGMEKAQKFINS